MGFRSGLGSWVVVSNNTIVQTLSEGKQSMHVITRLDTSRLRDGPFRHQLSGWVCIWLMTCDHPHTRRTESPARTRRS